MFLELETNNKNFVDLSNLQITKQTFKFRQIEKKNITDMFKDLTGDGRNLLTEMRKRNLGVWQENKVGLVKYNKTAYDKNKIQTELDSEESDQEDNDEEQDHDDIPPVQDHLSPGQDADENGYDEGNDGNNNDDDDNDE